MPIEHLNTGHFTEKALDRIDPQFSATTKSNCEGKWKRKEVRGNGGQRARLNRSQTQVQQTSCSQSAASIQLVQLNPASLLSPPQQLVGYPWKVIFTFTAISETLSGYRNKKFDFCHKHKSQHAYSPAPRHTHTHTHAHAFLGESRSFSFFLLGKRRVFTGY